MYDLYTKISTVKYSILVNFPILSLFSRFHTLAEKHFELSHNLQFYFVSINMPFVLTVLSNEKKTRKKASGDTVMSNLSGDRAAESGPPLRVAQMTKLGSRPQDALFIQL